MSFDPKRVAEEAKWLIANPHFEQRPASVTEFLGPGYLDIESKVRPGLKDALVGVFGEQVNPQRIANHERAMLTGGIGIGKTTFASIALPYMAHWVLCLKDPQGFFDLLPGSRIAFMQMSTSEKQALEVVFGDIFARIKHSRWFMENYPYDDKFTKQIRFPKDIWILPGDSAETTFEGYNILAGILDEMDSHKVTQQKDYADVGYDTIESRIASRFTNDEGENPGHRGLIICIGQMKKGNGFAARKYEEFMRDKKAYVVRMSIWESLGWQRYMKDGKRDSFWYDIKRKQIVPPGVVEVLERRPKNLIEVPTAYLKQFENNPEKALRDLAGIPPATADAFISLVHRIEEARDRWIDTHGEEPPVNDNPTKPEFAPWFRADGDPRKRTVHIDLATSGDGDALGFAMGHVSGIQEVDGENKPYITIDCLVRIKAMPGQEIMLSDIRRMIYELKDERRFRIHSVTLDGFQSTDTMQQLRRKRIFTSYLSVDRSTLPYEDLREAIYEGRIEFPPYLTYLRKGDTDRVEIAVKELMELQDTGKKIDHPTTGSKDIADAMAGVISTLMGDRTYRKGVSSIRTQRSELTDDEVPADGTTGTGAIIPFPDRSTGLKAPVPPSVGGFGITIPPRLQPRQNR